MKKLLLVLTLVTSLSVFADITTSQKVNCSAEAIQKVLGDDLVVLKNSIDLKPTAMKKYNLFANGIGALANLEQGQYTVRFQAINQHSDQLFSGKIILDTREKNSRYYGNNSTVYKEDLSGKLFKCTLTVTRFTGKENSYRDIRLDDLFQPVD